MSKICDCNEDSNECRFCPWWDDESDECMKEAMFPDNEDEEE